MAVSLGLSSGRRFKEAQRRVFARSFSEGQAMLRRSDGFPATSTDTATDSVGHAIGTAIRQRKGLLSGSQSHASDSVFQQGSWGHQLKYVDFSTIPGATRPAPAWEACHCPQQRRQA